MDSDISLRSATPGGQPPEPPRKAGRSQSLPGIEKCTQIDASFSPAAAKTDMVSKNTLTKNPAVTPKHPHKIEKASKTVGEATNTVFEKTVPPSLERRKTEPSLKTMRGQDIGRDREWEFIQKANASGIDFDTAKHLYLTSGGSAKDPLTGAGVIQDMQPTKEAALARSEKSGKIVLQIDVDIENLGKLNAAHGGSNADEIIKQISKTVKDNIGAAGVKMASFRDGGKFSFIVEADSEETKKKLEGVLKDTKKQVKLASKVDLEITSQTLEATGATPSTSNTRAASQPDTFQDAPWSSSQIRHNQFVRIAKSSNVSLEKAEELYTLSGGGEKDGLTGLDRATDRIPTLKNAQAEILKSGGSGVYIGIDIRNLKGINAAKGRIEADKEYANMVTIVKNELKALGMQVAGFRHGGDEISFVIVAEKGMPQTELNRACDKALKGAQQKIEGELPHLANIPHAKYPNQKGSGIAFGISPLNDKYSPETIIKIADERVEQSKVGSTKTRPSTTEIKSDNQAR